MTRRRNGFPVDELDPVRWVLPKRPSPNRQKTSAEWAEERAEAAKLRAKAGLQGTIRLPENKTPHGMETPLGKVLEAHERGEEASPEVLEAMERAAKVEARRELEVELAAKAADNLKPPRKRRKKRRR